MAETGRSCAPPAVWVASQYRWRVWHMEVEPAQRGGCGWSEARGFCCCISLLLLVVCGICVTNSECLEMYSFRIASVPIITN